MLRSLFLIALLSLVTGANAAGYSYTLEKVTVDPPSNTDPSYAPHVVKLNSFLEREVGPVLSEWNQSASGAGKISIEPHVQRLKLVRGAARFMVGPFVGGSYLSLRVDIRNEQTGEILDQREFMITSNAFKGMISMGERDRNIIPAAARQVAEYLIEDSTDRTLREALASQESTVPSTAASSTLLAIPASAPIQHVSEDSDRTSEVRLRELQHLKDQGLITEEEFAAKRKAVLSEI